MPKETLVDDLTFDTDLMFNSKPPVTTSANNTFITDDNLSIDLTENYDKELRRTGQKQYPTALELISSEAGIKEGGWKDISNYGSIMKYNFSSDPRDKIDAISNIISKKGYKISNTRNEDNQILFDVSAPNGKTVWTYTLNQKGADLEDIAQVGYEAIKYIPAVKGALIAKGASTGIAGVAKAIGGASLAGAGVRGAEESLQAGTQALGMANRQDIAGMPSPTRYQNVAEGAVVGAVGEGAFQVLSPIVKPVGRYIYDMGRKYFGDKSFYSKAIESGDPQKIADALNTAIDDTRLPETVRNNLKNIKEGNAEGVKLITQLAENEAKVNPLTSVGGKTQLQGSPADQFMASYPSGHPTAFGQTLPSLGKELEKISKDPSLNAKINLLFSEQDEMFKNRLEKLVQNSLQRKNEINPFTEQIAQRSIGKNPSEIQLLRSEIGSNLAGTGDVEPLLKQIADDKALTLKSVTDKIFEQSPATIKETFEKLDIALSKVDPDPLKAKEVIDSTKELIASDYISRKIGERLSKISKPEEVGKNILNDMIENKKLEEAIMVNNATKKIGADLARFEQMVGQITRGRSPEQIRELVKQPGFTIEDAYALSTGQITSPGILSKIGKFLKIFAPGDRQIAADLLSSNIKSKQILKSMDELRTKDPTEYLSSFNGIIQKVKKGDYTDIPVDVAVRIRNYLPDNLPETTLRRTAVGTTSEYMNPITTP